MFKPSDFFNLFFKNSEEDETNKFYRSEGRFNLLRHKEIAHVCGKLYEPDAVYLDGAYDAENDLLFFRLCIANDDADIFSFPACGTETYVYITQEEAANVLRKSGKDSYEGFSREDWIGFLS